MIRLALWSSVVGHDCTLAVLYLLFLVQCHNCIRGAYVLTASIMPCSQKLLYVYQNVNFFALGHPVSLPAINLYQLEPINPSKLTYHYKTAHNIKHSVTLSMLRPIATDVRRQPWPACDLITPRSPPMDSWLNGAPPHSLSCQVPATVQHHFVDCAQSYHSSAGLPVPFLKWSQCLPNQCPQWIP